MSRGRVVVAMSGGVDSSLAAALLRERGEDVVGVWMRLTADVAGAGPRCCGTAEAGDQARRAAAALDIPFFALDYAETFGRAVVDPFVASYAAGETPNPCVSCNAHVKFEPLLREAIATFGANRLATGHYARVTTDASGRRHLRRASDPEKDQSYALYMLGPDELGRLELPIGELKDKDETRALAMKHGLPNALAPESQDICFIDGDYRRFVRERAPEAFVPGPVEREDGTPVGRHGGVGTLTVGQRSGVGVANGERMYVLRFDGERNAAVVGPRSRVTATTYDLRDMRFTAGEPPAPEFAARAVLRYRGTPIPAHVTVTGLTAVVRLDCPALVAPGQALVLYGAGDADADEVLGGGIVTRSAGPV